jgi:hypothetical protein
VDVRVEPSGHHQAASEIDALGAARLARKIRRGPDGDDPTVALEERVGRRTGSDMDPSAVEESRAQA